MSAGSSFPFALPSTEPNFLPIFLCFVDSLFFCSFEVVPSAYSIHSFHEKCALETFRVCMRPYSPSSYYCYVCAPLEKSFPRIETNDAPWNDRTQYRKQYGRNQYKIHATHVQPSIGKICFVRSQNISDFMQSISHHRHNSLSLRCVFILLTFIVDSFIRRWEDGRVVRCCK